MEKKVNKRFKENINEDLLHYDEEAYILYQNNPNPFSEKTVIKFEINEKFESAFILVFDMQGGLKMTKPINIEGKGQININEHELISGMYLYTLVVDNKEIDTKRMILLK